MKGLPQLLKKIARLRILVVCDLMLDHYIWGDATRISPEAPVPVIDIARDSWTIYDPTGAEISKSKGAGGGDPAHIGNFLEVGIEGGHVAGCALGLQCRRVGRRRKIEIEKGIDQRLAQRGRQLGTRGPYIVDEGRALPHHAQRQRHRIAGAAAGAVLLRRRRAGDVHSDTQAAGAFPVRHRARAQVI